MNDFNMGRAWSLGFDFIRRAPGGHALLLVVLAVLVPSILQFALIGGVSSMMMNPAMLGQGGGGNALAYGGGLAAIAMLVSYVLQTAGYFGSWRLGLNRDTDVGGAAAYGLVAGILVVVLLIFGAIAAFLLTRVLGGLAVLVLVLLMLPLLAAFYSLIVAMMCIGMLFAGVIMAVFGAALGSAFASAPGAFGAGAVGVALIIGVSLLMLWLTARFCCVTSVLADRGNYNVFGALGESWRLTGRSQGMIMLYLSLVGLVLGVIFLLLSGLLAFGAVASMGSGGAPQMGAGLLVFTIVMGVAFAYVSVLVPAGIYRALRPDVDASASVFD